MIAFRHIQIAFGTLENEYENANCIERFSSYLSRLWEWIPGKDGVGSFWESSIHYTPDVSSVAWEKGELEIIPGTLSNLLSWCKKPSVVLTVGVTALVVYSIYKFSKFYRPYTLLLKSSQYRKKGDYQLALDSAHIALECAKEISNRSLEMKAYQILGTAHYFLSDYAKAIEYHKKHLAIAQSLGDRVGEGRAYGNLGIVHQHLGDYDLALEYLGDRLAIAVDLGDRAGEGRAYGNLGNAHLHLSNYPQAIEYHEKALAIAVDLGDQVGEGAAYANLGIAYRHLSNYVKAIEYQEKSLAIAVDLGDRAGEGGAYANLGNSHQNLRNYSLAIEYHEKHLTIARSLGDRAGEGTAYGNLGVAHDSLGNYAEAIEFSKKSLAIAQSLGDRANMGKTYGHLGSAYRSLGNYAEAIKYLKESTEISQSLRNRVNEGRAYGNLGLVLDSLGNYAKAIQCYEKALAIAEELSESDFIGSAYNNLGSSYVKLEDYPKAKEHYQKGIRTFSRIQHSLKEKYHAKITIFEEQSKAYFGLEKTFLLQHKHEDALVVSDSRRSRTLIDRIQKKLRVSVDSLDAPMQIEEMQDLAEKLGTTFVVFMFSPYEQADRAFGIWIIHPGQEIVYRSIEAPIIHKAIRSGGITPFQDISTLEKTKEGDGLDSLFACLPSPDLVTEVDKEQIAFLQDWYNELIAPILDFLPAEDDARIILVPDGPLMDLPFALLMDPEGRYLFEKYTISITPSITTLHLLMQRQTSSSEKNLIVGNPTAPDVSSLPFSTQEAKKVAEVTGTPVEDTFLEEEALKTTVLAKLEDSRFIHLACHGVPKTKDKHSIYDGAFYLTPDEKNPDGILYAEEIVSCDLNAELVLLSACHSGKGRQTKEGVIGPVRSFLAAGAQAVVATLWTLPDSELTITMVSQFYQHILGTSERAQVEGRPLDKDEALREVMRTAVLEGKRNRPQEWGAFFMTGVFTGRNHEAV